MATGRTTPGLRTVTVVAAVLAEGICPVCLATGSLGTAKWSARP